ncbi:MAG: hypothetical protein ACI9H6_000374 [Patiriisocius sp.]|jgi:hypothetical protein
MITLQFSTLRTLFIALLVCSFFFSSYLTQAAHAQSFASSDDVELAGWAWSANVGWISLNCSNTGSCGSSNHHVQINGGSTKTATGYAWSANVGWIQLGGLSGFPSGGEYGGNARVGGIGGAWQLEGWARALAHGDGWDGWISLSGTSPAYAVSFGNSGNMDSSAYAWGDDVVGWVNFDAVAFTPPCSVSAVCTGDNTGVIPINIWCEQETTVSCSAGTICASPSTSCAAPTGALEVSSNLVKKGATVQMGWSVVGVSGCYVTTSTGGADITNPNAGTTPGETPGYPSLTLPSGAIQETTTYSLMCTAVTGGTAVEVDTQTVRLLPTVFET